MPVSPTPSDSDTVYTFTVSLTVYSLIKKKTPRGKAAASKEEKSVKVNLKELQFSIDNTNYLDFLQSILNKHGQDQYMLLAKKEFLFKYIPPKTKR